MRLCKIMDCNKKHYAKEYCKKHWVKWNKYGDALWISKKITIEIECLICKKTFQRFPSLIRRRKHSFCSNECAGIYKRGKNNNNWNGGTSEYPNHYLMKKNRLIILMNNPKCEKCGDIATQVHHKDKSKDNHDLSNLQAVCVSCHWHLGHNFV